MALHSRPIRQGLRLSELGFGGAQIGNLREPVSDEQAQAAIDAAWVCGVRYFDTAPHYGLGLSERRLGRALAGRPRESYVLSTKVGRRLVPNRDDPLRPDDEGFAVPATHRRAFDFSRDGVLRSVEASLERLGTDRIDIAYLHDPDDHWAVASTAGIGALVELRDQGVVRAIGAGMNQSAMLAAFVERTDVDVVMLAGRYTLLDQSAQDDLLPAAAERGVAVVAAGVYNSGILSTATVPDHSSFEYRDAQPEVLARARRISEVCAQHGVTLPEAAVRFPLRSQQIVSVVLGTGSAEHALAGAARIRADVPEQVWTDLVRDGLLAEPQRRPSSPLVRRATT